MSNQGEDGWYPECETCGGGNLGDVVCKDCYDKLKSNLRNKIKEEIHNLKSWLTAQKNENHIEKINIRIDTLNWVLSFLGE